MIEFYDHNGSCPPQDNKTTMESERFRFCGLALYDMSIPRLFLPFSFLFLPRLRVDTTKLTIVSIGRTSAMLAFFTITFALVVQHVCSLQTTTTKISLDGTTLPLLQSVRGTRLFGTGVGTSDVVISGANKRLYQDHIAATTRRANMEKTILQPIQELMETDVKSKVSKPASGTGFASKTSKSLEAEEWAKVLKMNGVIRLDNCLKKETTKTLRDHALDSMAKSKEEILRGEVGAREVLGMELERKHRDDYLMSFAPPAIEPGGSYSHPVAIALNELFGDNGKLRQLYEIIVTKKGILYELAAMVTEPGADRQMIHADMPWQTEPPLYSIFCALQDVSLPMGPTVFLPGTNTAQDHKRWKDKTTFDEYLGSKVPYVALLKAGDLIVYDPRILHCGAENEPTSGNVRAMFNVGFRNPKFLGDFGYKGSLRTGYSDQITFGDLISCLDGFKENSKRDPFEKFGNGLRAVEEFKAKRMKTV